MRIGPLFKWFGSKWSAAKRGAYPAPQHNIIIEPFAGGAGYSLNYCDRQVVLWEEDPNLVDLWGWLIGPATPEAIREIPTNIQEGTNILGLGLTIGQSLLLKHWQRTNNVGECWTISPWGNKPGQWTANTRARVADQVGAVKHWRIGAPIDWVDRPATWFIDPPYQYNYKYRVGLPKMDYNAIDSLVQTIARVSLVICCEATGKGGEIPTYLPFRPSHSQVTSRRKATENHHSTELVYVRSPT